MNNFLTVALVAFAFAAAIGFAVQLNRVWKLEDGLAAAGQKQNELYGRLIQANNKLSDFISYATGYRASDPHLAFAALQTFVVEERNSLTREVEERVARRLLSNPALRLSDDERAVLSHMNGKDVVVKRFSQLAELTGLPENRVRAILRNLAGEGLAELGFLAGDQGSAAGRGYWLTSKGLAVRDAAKRLPA